MHSPTDDVARFALATKLEKIPGKCIEKSKYHLVDYIAVVLAGSKEEPSKIIRQYVLEQGGKGKSLIFGGSSRVRIDEAALVNGIQAHVLDYDDVNQSMYGHPSCAILPAAFAIGETTRCSGSQLLEAYILGVEIAGKIGSKLNPSHYKLGWHSTCTLGTIGAAVASAKIIGMEIDKFKMVMGMAASLAGGLKANFGTMTKSYHAGRAAENGVRAALMVQHGWDACDHILDDHAWFTRPFMGDCECNLEEIVDYLGGPYEIISPGIIVKKYPSCAFTHPAIDAIQEIMANNLLKVSEVKKIVVTLHKMANQVLIHRKASNGLEGKFCIEYCLASTIVLGRCGLANFSMGNVSRRKVQYLSQLVERKIDQLPSETDNIFGPSEVAVHLKTGGLFKTKIDVAKGDPSRPLSHDEMHKKYMECATVLYDKERAEDILEHLKIFDEIEDIKQFTDSLL